MNFKWLSKLQKIFFPDADNEIWLIDVKIFKTVKMDKYGAEETLDHPVLLMDGKFTAITNKELSTYLNDNYHETIIRGDTSEFTPLKKVFFRRKPKKKIYIKTGEVKNVG